MQFIRCAVVGVLMVLYLWTNSWCLYVPERKEAAAAGRGNETSAPSARVQICGDALTTFIIELCNGFVGSLNQVSSSRESARARVTEDCCNRGCTMDYLHNYCGGSPLFSIRNIRLGKTPSPKNFLKTLSQTPSVDLVPGARTVDGRRSEGAAEVRIRNKNGGKRKKRKRSFKRKCAYKSFGHYLLKLDRAHRAREDTAKSLINSKNRNWPSIQIGTVSPEMDKFGGQPIVVVKNTSNSVRASNIKDRGHIEY